MVEKRALRGILSYDFILFLFSYHKKVSNFKCQFQNLVEVFFSSETQWSPSIPIPRC